MDNKYSSHGYIRLWIPTSDNAKKLQEIRALIAQPIKLKQIFDNLYNEELSL